MRSITKLISLGVLVLMISSTTSAAPANDPGVEAFDTRGGERRPCPPVDTSGNYVRGGCKSFATTLQTNVVVRTAFGALPFGYHCAFSFNLHIDRTGRTWMDRILIGGGAATPCNDIRPCEPNALKPSPADRRNKGADNPVDFDPWRGQLRAEGDRFINRFDMCVDTCAGRFEGQMEFALVREDAGWTVRAEAAPAGTSGLAFDGEWPLDPGRFDLVAEN